MEDLSSLDWKEFLAEYPGMKIRPCAGTTLAFQGTFDFTAVGKGHPRITDSYQLSIRIPEAFPNDLPITYETAGRIPCDRRHHINHDQSLCLGAPIRILLELSKKPTLLGYAEKCLVPYLYAMSLNLNHGVPFAFGELAHGTEGELQDYIEMFGLKTPLQAKQALSLLSMKERVANKQPCPCGCRKRLGTCNFRNRLNAIRQLTSLSWFRANLPH